MFCFYISSWFLWQDNDEQFISNKQCKLKSPTPASRAFLRSGAAGKSTWAME
jgi:hypothetical protein